MTALRRIPAVFMRGGTSKALIFHARDLPESRAGRDAMFFAALGSPDANGRQLDGMGGGLSSLSKVCIVGPSSRADADVDYTFVQISVDAAIADYSGNCGNMASAIGPFALEEGLIPPPTGNGAVVRIHNTNTGKIIAARFPIEHGLLAADGDFALDGIAGTAAPIKLEFLDPGGTKTGRLLPTGNLIDRLDVPGIGRFAVSCIDAANPAVFVEAGSVGMNGTEMPGMLEADIAFIATMEAIRLAASVHMGLAADIDAARRMPAIPKVAIVAAPADAPSLSGRRLRADEMDIAVRMISVGQPHRAVPITGAICLAVAARIPGTIPNIVCAGNDGPISIGHPSGTIVVDAELGADRDGTLIARNGAVFRSARRLFDGHVVIREP